MIPAKRPCICVLSDENFSVVLLKPRDALWSMAITAAAPGYATNGSSLSCSRHAIAKMPQRRQPRLLSPRVRHYGGCSRASRRVLWRKIRNPAPLSRIPAVHFGVNFANPAIDRHFTQLTKLWFVFYQQLITNDSQSIRLFNSRLTIRQSSGRYNHPL